LRNIYLTDRYSEIEKQKEQDSKLMGTSTNVISNVYTKTD